MAGQKISEVLAGCRGGSVGDDSSPAAAAAAAASAPTSPPCCSFEFFPPKTKEGCDNLVVLAKTLSASVQPSYFSITDANSREGSSRFASLELCERLSRECADSEAMLHITCQRPKEEILQILKRARAAGIRNVFALRGDSDVKRGAHSNRARIESETDVDGILTRAIDLVRLIRREHGDYFCIAVAAYPEVHTECWNSEYLPPSLQKRELDLRRLKDKVDAGADFVVTQFFFDASLYIDFRRRCAEADIAVPIVPGLLPIQNFNTFQKFTSWCRTFVPKDMRRRLESIKDNDEAVKLYGIEIAVEMCKTLLSSGVCCLHFFTMNLGRAVSRIITEMNLSVNPVRLEAEALPFGVLADIDDEYPNGRWGDSCSPAYGELTSYYVARKRPKLDERKMLGTPSSVKDVAKVFVRYLRGAISELPWCDQMVADETAEISGKLCWINQMGFLTINSQPKVNGVPSTHPRFGWGGPGGYVFQKAYLEFFCSPESWKRLHACLDKRPGITYHATDASSGAVVTNRPAGETINAVTWGVFPQREIIQPTVVDSTSFEAWAREAFDLWMSRWYRVYLDHGERDEAARNAIKEIHDTWYLVNMVENDYVDGNVFDVFSKIIVANMDAEELRRRVVELEEENELLHQELRAMRSKGRRADRQN